MAKKKRVNPRRKPANHVDIADVKQEAQDKSISEGIALFLTVMKDKRDASIEDITRIWEAVNILSEKVSGNGDLLLDMVDNLKKDCGIEIDLVMVPHHIHKGVTLADVLIAKKKARQRAINLSAALFLTVMKDTEHWGNDDLKWLQAEMMDLQDSINKGYITAQDLYQVLDEEYQIEVKVL